MFFFPRRKVVGSSESRCSSRHFDRRSEFTSSRLGRRTKDRLDITRHITQPLTRSRVLFLCPFQHQLQTLSALSVSGRCALRSLRLASHSRIFRSRLFQLIIPFVLQRLGFQTFTHYRKRRGLVNLEIESDPNISHCSRIERSCAYPD